MGVTVDWVKHGAMTGSCPNDQRALEREINRLRQCIGATMPSKFSHPGSMRKPVIDPTLQLEPFHVTLPHSGFLPNPFACDDATTTSHSQ
jgi:hypothetical protein